MPNNGDDKKKKGYRINLAAFQPGSSKDYRETGDFDVDWTDPEIAAYEEDMSNINQYLDIASQRLYEKYNVPAHLRRGNFFKNTQVDDNLKKDSYLSAQEFQKAVQEAGLDSTNYYNAIKRMQDRAGKELGNLQGDKAFAIDFSGKKEGRGIPIEQQAIGQQHLTQAYKGGYYDLEEAATKRPGDQVIERPVYTGQRREDPKTGKLVGSWDSEQSRQASRITEENLRRGMEKGTITTPQGQGVSRQEHVLPTDYRTGTAAGSFVAPQPAPEKMLPNVQRRVDPQKHGGNPYISQAYGGNIYANGGPINEFDPVRAQSDRIAMEQALAARRAEAAADAPPRTMSIQGTTTSDPGFTHYADFERKREDLLREKMSDKQFLEESKAMAPMPEVSSFDARRMTTRRSGEITDGSFNPYIERNPYTGPTSFYKPPVQYIPDNSTMMVDPGRGRAAAGSFANGGTMQKIGAGFYGAAEGILDTATFGLTDNLTDKVNFNNPEAEAIRAGTNIAGNVTGAFINPAAVGTAISQSGDNLKDLANTGVVKDENLNKVLNVTGTAAEIRGSFVGGGAESAGELGKFAQGMQDFSQNPVAQGILGGGSQMGMGMPMPTPGMNFGYGGKMRSRYEHGGEMSNTTAYTGNTHENGGIPLGNTGNEVEDGEVRWDSPDGESYIFSNRINFKK